MGSAEAFAIDVFRTTSLLAALVVHRDAMLLGVGNAVPHSFLLLLVTPFMRTAGMITEVALTVVLLAVLLRGKYMHFAAFLKADTVSRIAL